MVVDQGVDDDVGEEVQANQRSRLSGIEDVRDAAEGLLVETDPPGADDEPRLGRGSGAESGDSGQL